MTTKEQLLRLMSHDDHSVAIKCALNSGLLPSNLRKRWAETFVKRGINEVLGESDCPAWEAWATSKWLSANDRSQSSAEDARFIAARCASLVAGMLPARKYVLEFAKIIASHAEDRAAELKHQYRDLLALINEI